MAGSGSAAVLGVRLLLCVAYPALSHVATVQRDGRWAAVALADIVVLLLLDPLSRRRPWAWAVAIGAFGALAASAGSTHALLLLLAVPIVFTGWVAWWFARTLRPGEVPLITQFVKALYAQAGMATHPELLRYSRRLTVAWAGLLGLMTLANAGLALVAVPGGVLHQLGHSPWPRVTDEQWSLFANLLNYGIVGGFMAVEYPLRNHWFPEKPYRNAIDFGRQMARLGPDFWRSVMR